MFNTKKDRRVVEITIEFDIVAIAKWLKAGSKIEDIDKIKRNWEDAVIQKYVIDMFPIGKIDNAYFHRNKGIISQNICGVDYLENAEENIKYIAEKEAGIKLLAWDMRRGCLSLKANRELILLTPPLTEVIELEKTGILSNPRFIKDDDTKIKVPFSFDDDNKPKEFMNIWRGSSCDRSLGYGNGLGHISFSTLNFEVEY